MKLPLLILITFISSLGFSQKETNNWYFGNNSGIEFNNGNPNPTIGQLNTIEGCTSISNANGYLLFYTNGHTVWNKNHQVMPNGTGLFGDLSSSQAAVIVKKPGSETIYYIFTSNPFPDNGGLRYTEVDMSQNNATGAVTAKNILLYQPTCEKIAVVNHSNGLDVWVVSHEYGTDGFNATLVTADGVSTNPVISNTGLTVSQDSDFANAIGYMKISPDGKKLVACHTFLTKAELFDFDAATGHISNPQVISNDGMHVYGAEFATNSDLLYIASVDEKKLFQFDLRATNIAASRLLLGDFSATLGALQMARDGKIYLAMAETNQLSVISSPDMIGNACGLQTNQVYLDGMCMLGLPGFNASFFDDTIKITNTCALNESYFTVSTGQTIQSVLWNFGDNTTSTDISPSHTYATAGTYLVTSTVTNGSCVIIKAKRFTISGAHATAIADQSLCIVSNQVYHLSQNNAAILDGQSLQDVGIAYFATQADAENQSNSLPDDYLLQPGTATFFARVNSLAAGCYAITNFNITSSIQPTAVAPTDFNICDSAPLDGIESFDLTLKDLEILGGQDSNLFHVSYYNSQADADADLNAITSPYINTNPIETLYARVSNTGSTCYVVVPMNIHVLKQPKEIQMSDFISCDDGPLDGFATFDLALKDEEALHGQPASDFNISYFVTIEDAQNNVSPIVGLYTNISIGQKIYVRLESVEGGCSTIAAFHLVAKACEEPAEIPFSYPKYFTPNGDGIHDYWQIISSNSADIDVAIFDRNGKLIKMMSGKDSGWDGTINGQPLPQSDYWFIASEKNKEHRGHFSMVR